MTNKYHHTLFYKIFLGSFLLFLGGAHCLAFELDEIGDSVTGAFSKKPKVAPKPQRTNPFKSFQATPEETALRAELIKVIGLKSHLQKREDQKQPSGFVPGAGLESSLKTSGENSEVKTPSSQQNGVEDRKLSEEEDFSDDSFGENSDVENDINGQDKKIDKAVSQEEKLVTCDADLTGPSRFKEFLEMASGNTDFAKIRFGYELFSIPEKEEDIETNRLYASIKGDFLQYITKKNSKLIRGLISLKDIGFAGQDDRGELNFQDQQILKKIFEITTEKGVTSSDNLRYMAIEIFYCYDDYLKVLGTQTHGEEGMIIPEKKEELAIKVSFLKKKKEDYKKIFGTEFEKIGVINALKRNKKALKDSMDLSKIILENVREHFRPTQMFSDDARIFAEFEFFLVSIANIFQKSSQETKVYVSSIKGEDKNEFHLLFLKGSKGKKMTNVHVIFYPKIITREQNEYERIQKQFQVFKEVQVESSQLFNKVLKLRKHLGSLLKEEYALSLSDLAPGAAQFFDVVQNKRKIMTITGTQNFSKDDEKTLVSQSSVNMFFKPLNEVWSELDTSFFLKESSNVRDFFLIFAQQHGIICSSEDYVYRHYIMRDTHQFKFMTVREGERGILDALWIEYFVRDAS